jgi:transposase
VRELYSHADAQLATEWIEQLILDMADQTWPLEVRSLGRTLAKWRHEIIAWHHAHFTNGPTEAMNNLIKRVKRVAFGFTSFRNYRIRSLLSAGKPNWDLLATVTPR